MMLSLTGKKQLKCMCPLYEEKFKLDRNLFFRLQYVLTSVRCWSGPVFYTIMAVASPNEGKSLACNDILDNSLLPTLSPLFVCPFPVS